MNIQQCNFRKSSFCNRASLYALFSKLFTSKSLFSESFRPKCALFPHKTISPAYLITFPNFSHQVHKDDFGASRHSHRISQLFYVVSRDQVITYKWNKCTFPMYFNKYKPYAHFDNNLRYVVCAQHSHVFDFQICRPIFRKLQEMIIDCACHKWLFDRK